MEKDGVRFTGIRAPQDDEVGLLDLPIRTCPPAQTEYRRQTDDAGGMSSPVTTVDVVAPHHNPGELLGKEVELIGGLRATEDSKGLWSAFSHRSAKARSGAVKRFIPTGGTKRVVITNQRLSESNIASRHDYSPFLMLLTNWSKLSSHLAMVFSGPTNLKNQGACEVSTTAANMR